MIVATDNSYLLSCWDNKTAIFKRTYCQVNNNNVIEDINRNHMLRVGLFCYQLFSRVQDSKQLENLVNLYNNNKERKKENLSMFFERLYK